MNTYARHLLAISITAVLAACGGGGGSTSNPPVAAAPAITTAPVSSTVNAGGTVTLSVVASGASNLSYQWKRDGVDIAGATAASYTTPVLAVGDSGKAYTVVVSDATGQSTTSSAAVLTVNATVTAAIALSQTSANQLVADVNAGVSSLRQADAVALLPFGAQTSTLPMGATIDQTIDCGSLDGGTGSGSGTISFTTNVNDSTGQPVSTQFAYNNCSFGGAGFSYSINGTGGLTYTNWTNETSFTFRLVYNMTYSFTNGGYSDAGTLNSVQTCIVNGDLEDCSYSFGDNQVRDVTLSTNGSVTTVSQGRISNDYVDCLYNGWVFDSTTGRATAGTVTVTAPNGDRAVITAANNGYTVVITVGGSSNTFTVAFSS